MKSYWYRGSRDRDDVRALLLAYTQAMQPRAVVRENSPPRALDNMYILQRYNALEMEMCDSEGYPLSWNMSFRAVVRKNAEIEAEREAARPALREKLQAAQLRQKWAKLNTAEEKKKKQKKKK